MQESKNFGKKLLIAFKPEMIARMDQVAHREHRNRSELAREAVRQYLYNSDLREAQLQGAANPQ